MLNTVGDLDGSLLEKGHETAGAVVDVLSDEGVEVFAVARVDDGLRLGVMLEQRHRVLEILARRLGRPGVLLGWQDGGRSGLVPLAAAPRDRHVVRARSWNIFSAYSWGERVLGESAATEVTFWELGTSGQRELVGTRGQDRFHPESPRTPAVVDGRTYPGIATFPVGRNFEEFHGDIDIVYTWVDGDDPEWRSDFNRWAERERETLLDSAIDRARFHNRDELRYSMRSVWAYCGWVRKIFVVTSGQVPPWLATDERVQVVPHPEILAADALPTFNSHAIEASLHHIEGLSEHFIYFNDDMFIGRPTRPELFFTPNGLARVFSSSAYVHGSEFADTLAVDTAAIRGRELLLEHFGRVMSTKPLHSPYPLRRSVLDQVEAEFPDLVRQTQHSRFRSPSDLSIAASFGQHFALALGKAVPGELRTEYVHVESGRLKLALDRIELGDDVDSFCVNETLYTSADHAGRERRLAGFFDRMFPVAAPWEKRG